MNLQSQRYLNFNTFLEDRSIQINKLSSILALETQKKGHQSLAKSLRRRAMSHNKYRIPLRIRKGMQQFLDEEQKIQKLPKCRKHIRKRHRLINAYKQRQNNGCWLSNHLWAAKRMHMQAYYGYKVAFTPHDKCFRSSYRQLRHGCCLMNLSFWECLFLRYSHQTCYNPSNISLKKNGKQVILSALKTDEYYQGILYNNVENKNPICPIIAILSNNLDNYNTLRCFFHPAARQQVQNLIYEEFIETRIQTINIDIYLLLGPQSIFKVMQTLKKQSNNSINSHASSKFAIQRQNLSYFYFQHQQKTKPFIMPPLKQGLSLKTQYSIRQNQKIRELIMANIKTSNDTINQESLKKFWNFFDERQNKDFQNIFDSFSTRSKYTHRRKTKIPSHLKKKKIKELVEQKVAAQEKKGLKVIEKEKIKQEVIILKQQSQIKMKQSSYSPIAVLNIRKSQINQGCIVLSSNINRSELWTNLTFSRCKVIGLQQYWQLKLEIQQLRYPEDYPFTKGFCEHQNKQAIKYFEKMMRKPAQKRVDFLKINSKYPLSKKIFYGQKCRIVRVQMVGQGRCFIGSYLCKIQLQDMIKLEKNLNDYRTTNIVCSQEQNQSSLNLYSNTDIDDLSLKLAENCKNIRQVIGFITSGGYIYSKSRQGGIGYIFSEQYPQHTYVLIRKKTSLHYMLGKIQGQY